MTGAILAIGVLVFIFIIIALAFGSAARKGDWRE